MTMVVDSLIVPQCVYRPGTFTGLMTLYESNYIKLHQLVPALEWPAAAIVSSTPRDNDLHAEIVRREPYTTTLRLTYWFDDAGIAVADPDIVVRIYHDARLVALPLPPGVPYEEQQSAWASWKKGVLRIPQEEMASLAGRIARRI